MSAMSAVFAWGQSFCDGVKKEKREIAETIIKRDVFICDNNKRDYIFWWFMLFAAASALSGLEDFFLAAEKHDYVAMDGFIINWAKAAAPSCMALSLFALAAGVFVAYAADLIIISCTAAAALFFYPFGLVQSYTFMQILLFFWFPVCLWFLYLLPAFIKSLWRTFRLDKDRQAHLLFLLSMAALGWALWLQSGGNWQQMASLNSPITIPGFDPIPFTASISFPFALLGWIENSAGSALSFASAASTNEILALFASAAVLFFFALNRIQLSAVGVRPEFALLAFALFWVSVFFDVALHWSGAPVLPPVLILFNRAFAVLALGVSLFWRNAAKQGEDVPGADGEYRKACDAAEQTARKIGLWLLALVWLATQLSHANLSPVAFYWVKCAMISVFVAMPLRLMIQFKLDFQKALGRYNQLLALWQQSYKPPPTVATDEQVRDALNGGRGIGGKDWNDTGE